MARSKYFAEGSLVFRLACREAMIEVGYGAPGSAHFFAAQPRTLFLIANAKLPGITSAISNNELGLRALEHVPRFQ